jgi:hypothetical protein
MNYQDVSQQAAFAGDAEQGNPETITTGDLMMSNTAALQETTTTPPIKRDEEVSSDKNKPAADWRKSDKEWQQATEKAAKFDKLVSALTIDEQTKLGKNVDPVEATVARITDLEMKLERSEWEKTNLPRDISTEALETWREACARKADPEDRWSRLSYEELWTLSNPVGNKPAMLNPEVKENVDKVIHANKFNTVMGSVSLSGGAPINSSKLSSLDQAVASAMGWTEQDYKDAGVEV